MVVNRELRMNAKEERESMGVIKSSSTAHAVIFKTARDIFLVCAGLPECPDGVAQLRRLFIGLFSDGAVHLALQQFQL